jgi:hypothetical protein
MAATARQRSASRDRRPILARAGRKTDESRPGRLRRHPARAVGGRGRTSTRRPPRRSALVAHPRSATANAEQRPRHGQRCPSDETENHAGTRPAATQAALGPAAGIRSEPLKTSLSQHRRCIGRGLLPRAPHSNQASRAAPAAGPRTAPRCPGSPLPAPGKFGGGSCGTDVGRVPPCVHDAAWLEMEPDLNHHVVVATRPSMRPRNTKENSSSSLWE